MSERKRAVQLVFGCLAMLMVGVIYAWSVLRMPLAENFPAWSESQLQFCFTLTMWFMCLGSLFSGFCAKRVSVRVRLLLSAVLVATGFGIVSSIKGGIGWLYLGYGVLASSGIGIAYITILSTVIGHFMDRKGLVTGALMMSFGFSSLLYSKVGTALLSGGVLGWRSIYLLFGLICGVVLAISAFVLRKAQQTKSSVARVEAADGVSTGRMLRSLLFWKLFVFLALLAAVGSTAIGMSRNYFASIGLSESLCVSLAGCLSIINGLGRIASGALCDRLGKTKTRLTASGIVITSSVLCLVCLLTNIPALGIVGLFLCGFSYGFSPTLSSVLVGDFFGMRHYELNFSVLNMSIIPASFVSTIAGMLYESSNSYQSTFVLLTVMSLIGLGLNLLMQKR